MSEKLSKSADLHQAPHFSTFVHLLYSVLYIQVGVIVIVVAIAVAMTIDYSLKISLKYAHNFPSYFVHQQTDR